MELSNKVIVITGAASGIGEALAIRFAKDKPAALVLTDLPAQQAALDAVATKLGDAGNDGPTVMVHAADVGQESQVQALTAAALERFGQIDLFCSNAGIIRDGSEHAPDAEWDLNFQIHVMAHVYAARAVVPAMVAAGGGYLLNTASAAGLITSLPSATYAVSKHAAIAFAEYLSIRHGDSGVRVSVLCPQAVATPMIEGRQGAMAAANDGVMTPADLADCVVAGLATEQFLILPHADVLTYFQRKAQDYDRWLGGMRRFAKRLGITGG
ncbi:MAG: SDR family NAD(P)-dependent oxidoreductase [Burkholderiaceae bacterium]